MAQRQREFERTNVPIDQTGDLCVVAVPGDALVSVDIDATAATDFEIDRSTTGDETDRLGVEATYTNTDSVADVFRFGDRYLHVRVAAAAAAGQTADLTVQVGR